MSDPADGVRTLAADDPGFRVEELPTGELAIGLVTGERTRVRIIGYEPHRPTAFAKASPGDRHY